MGGGRRRRRTRTRGRSSPFLLTHAEAATTAVMLARDGGGGRHACARRRGGGRGPPPEKKQRRCAREEAARRLQWKWQCLLPPRCPCPIVPRGSKQGHTQLRTLRLVIQVPRRPRPCSRPSGLGSSRGRRRLSVQSDRRRRHPLPRAVRRDVRPCARASTQLLPQVTRRVKIPPFLTCGCMPGQRRDNLN